MEVRQTMQEVERWAMFELSFNVPSEGEENPYRDVRFSARFQYRNRTVEPEGFYDGDGVYRIRFMPDETGPWRYETSSSLT
ncbi:DUF5060 domain-containing protein, partial [Paenibacillus sepulcri]|nr:DUF5060 domain-containing protein [Paenibacillus sepulcri]